MASSLQYTLTIGDFYWTTGGLLAYCSCLKEKHQLALYLCGVHMPIKRTQWAEATGSFGDVVSFAILRKLLWGSFGLYYFKELKAS